MKACDIFGLVVRITGFLLILYGLRCELYAAGSLASAVLKGGDGLQRSFNWLSYGLPIFAFGSVGLLCADWVIKLTYREPLEGPPSVVATTLKPWDIYGVVIRLLELGFSFSQLGIYFTAWRMPREFHVRIPRVKCGFTSASESPWPWRP